MAATVYATNIFYRLTEYFMMTNTNLCNAFNEMENHFFHTISSTHVDYGNIIAYATGVFAANLNPAIIKRVDSSFATSLIACNAFYLDQKIPWALVLPEHTYNDKVEQFLFHHQFKFTGEGTAMALPINEVLFPLKNSLLTIQDIKDDLNTWSIPLMHAFGETPATPGLYAVRHQQAAQKNTNLYHFSGFIDDTVVCSLTLSLYKNYARIDDLSTMPAYQSKGYATDLLYAALKHAQTSNIETCFLEASADGLSLYKRMGFQELFTNRYYEIVD